MSNDDRRVFSLTIDAQSIASEFDGFKEEVELALNEAVRSASAMTYAKVNELASERLKSTLSKYQRALSYQEVYPGLWTVELDESVMWLEEGREPGSMVDDLLKNNAKVSKDGKRYKSIPFEHSARAGDMGNQAKELVRLLKKELSARAIPFRKIERDASGSPRIGKLHTFNVPSSPKPTKMANTPALMGVSIYQKMTKRGAVKRDILTFRTVTDDHKAEGKWFHPGLAPRKLMDEAFDWIEHEFETKILPETLSRFGGE